MKYPVPAPISATVSPDLNAKRSDHLVWREPEQPRRIVEPVSQGSMESPIVHRAPQIDGLQLASFRPMARRMVIAGHQFVNADCNRLSPTKTVSQSQ